MTDRAALLLQGSYRGVPFKFLDAGSSHGRRGPTHEYAKRDEPYFEDLGRKTRQYILDVFAVGDDWQSQRDALLAAVEQQGVGTLIHPSDGKMKAVCLDCRRQETVTALGRVDFTLTFLPQGNALPSMPARDTGGDVDNGASGAQSASVNAFTSAFQFVGQALRVITETTAMISTALGAVQGAVGFVTGNLGAAAAWFSYTTDTAGIVVRNAVNDLDDALATITDTSSSTLFDPQQAVSWLADVTSMTAAGTLLGAYPALGAQFGEVVAGLPALYKTGSGDAWTSWAQQRRVGVATTVMRAASTSDASGAMVEVETGGLPASTIADFITLMEQLATSLARPASTLPTNPSAVQTRVQANTDAVYDVMRQAALIQAAQAMSAYPFSSRTEAESMRDVLSDAFDAEMDIVTDDATVAALSTLRIQMVKDVQARTAGLPDVVSMTLTATVPAITLAERLYDQPGMAQDLVQRNGVRHPLFMPAGTAIEVLTDAD